MLNEKGVLNIVSLVLQLSLAGILFGLRYRSPHCLAWFLSYAHRMVVTCRFCVTGLVIEVIGLREVRVKVKAESRLEARLKKVSWSVMGGMVSQS